LTSAGADRISRTPQGTRHKTAGLALDESLTFGEYYFMEALGKALPVI
jgi:hypothetical protein